MTDVWKVQKAFMSSRDPKYAVREFPISEAQVKDVLAKFNLTADAGAIAAAVSSGKAPCVTTVEDPTDSTVVALMIAPTGLEME